MRKFNVTVNGNSYEVEIEEVGAAAVSAPVAPVVTAAAPTAPVVQAAKAPAAAPVAAKPAVPAGGSPVNAPMPGTILKLSQKNGASVKKGAVVCILEAMKMENEIVSPADGIITYSVSEGASISSGDVIAVLS